MDNNNGFSDFLNKNVSMLLGFIALVSYIIGLTAYILRLESRIVSTNQSLNTYKIQSRSRVDYIYERVKMINRLDEKVVWMRDVCCDEIMPKAKIYIGDNHTEKEE
jgi:hypothetical protein